MNIVWFKRDLRLYDHTPLYKASLSKEKTLCLLIIEPLLWKEPDLSDRQFTFYKECIEDLKKQAQKLNIPLTIRVGDTVTILENIHKTDPINTLFSHQETWNNWTYQRDIAVKKWAQSNNVTWKEYCQFAVFRQLKNRDGWSKKWNELMNTSLISHFNADLFTSYESDPIPQKKELFNSLSPCTSALKGGRKEGLKLLHSFFEKRGCFYTKEMSSPNTSPTACSRLSPYIAFGCLSMKEIHHHTKQFQTKTSFNDRTFKKEWKQATRSFSGRLRWHCHFIQKLEDQPSLEYKNIHSEYDSVAYHPPDHHDYFDRWKNGQTGYPLIDACMRALHAWGWLNFRMRAMVMSFAAHHLWLHWKDPAIYLATQFIDYEPGIHYSQCQMQAGTTGINAIRIYNPIKQGVDQDPQGEFIKEWIPELKECPIKYIHTPWEWDSEKNKYPQPIVNEKEARQKAASNLYKPRKNSHFKKEAQSIVKRHASRKKSSSKKSTSSRSNDNQLSLL